MSEWIAVAERLPKDNETVLLAGGGKIDYGWQIGGAWFNWYEDDDLYEPAPLYWLPIPEPPEDYKLIHAKAPQREGEGE